MIELTEDLLQEITQTIVETVNPEQIVLFGSAATGVISRNSDIDLLIVERDPFCPERSRQRESKKIRQALSRFRIPKDILVFSSYEVEKWRASVNHVISNAFKTGKVLYGRH